MLREAADLGFTHVELSHGLRGSLVPGVLKGLEEGVVKVGSCHNFCPLPPGVLHPAPNLYQPTAPDSREVDQWVRHTKRSLDFAAMVGAGVLVCHLGSVPFWFFNPATRLDRYLKRNPKADYREDPTFARLRGKCVARMKKAQEACLVRQKDALLRVFEYAVEKGILLGFENREHFDELPMDDGFGVLFSSLPEGAPVAYWHDCGHADIKERMGLLDHRAHLEGLCERLAGFHVHDVSDAGKDHQELGSGHIDFEMISSFWRAEHRLVLELSPRLTPDQVLRSRECLEALRGRRFPV